MNTRVRFHALTFALAGALWAAAAGATSWELTITLSGPGADAMQIRVCDTQTGAIIGTYASNAHQATNDFTVDFNGQAGADVSLSPNRPYTLTFIGWNKSCYIEGNMPPGQTNYDDFWTINGTTNAVTHVSGPFLQDVWGFPGATCGGPPPLDLQLVIDSQTRVGDKIIFKLRGTASGGTGPYTFSWTQATMTTGANVNPSLATRTILISQSYTVTCTVTNAVGSLTKSILLEGGLR